MSMETLSLFKGKGAISLVKSWLEGMSEAKERHNPQISVSHGDLDLLPFEVEIVS